MDAVYPVLSGALAQEKRMQMITNNLANVGTTGFKKDVPVFEGMVPTTDVFAMPLAGTQDTSTTFGTLRGSITDLTPGAIRTTGEPLDVAIEGEGFFAVETPQGTRYTRNGQFSLNAEGLLSMGGHPVQGAGGPISLPEGAVIIDTNGTILVRGIEPGAAPVEIDLLTVYGFADPQSLKKVGGNLFEAASGAATPVEGGRLLQGALEASNVNPVEEMVAMIEVMRLYEAAQKAIQTADEIAGKAANEIAEV